MRLYAETLAGGSARTKRLIAAVLEDFDWLQGEMVVPYQLIRQAILDRRCASALYDGYIRVFCPRTIGKDKDGATVVEAFQYGGGHPGGLPSGGEWCCFDVNSLDWISVNGDAWRAGADSERQGDRVVDVDVSS